MTWERLKQLARTGNDRDSILTICPGLRIGLCRCAFKFLACVALTGPPDGVAQGVLLSPKSYATQVSGLSARLLSSGRVPRSHDHPKVDFSQLAHDMQIVSSGL